MTTRKLTTFSRCFVIETTLQNGTKAFVSHFNDKFELADSFHDGCIIHSFYRSDAIKWLNVRDECWINPERKPKSWKFLAVKHVEVEEET